jgi:hypothetical protein
VLDIIARLMVVVSSIHLAQQEPTIRILVPHHPMHVYSVQLERTARLLEWNNVHIVLLEVTVLQLELALISCAQPGHISQTTALSHLRLVWRVPLEHILQVEDMVNVLYVLMGIMLM